jgi:hypothetical protein
MKHLFRLTLCFLALALLPGAASKKTDVGIRFHTEANPNDTAVFSTSVVIQYPTSHQAYVEQVPRVSEREVRAIYPFPANDGSYGCAFYLDNVGLIHLEALSSERRGTCLVVFLQTKLGVHHVTDLLIDKKITDGIIVVPHGFTQLEIAALQKQFKTLAPEKAPQKK